MPSLPKRQWGSAITGMSRLPVRSARALGAGIAAHNKEEQGLGYLPATPPEVRAAIIWAITLELSLRNEADVQAFIDDLKACVLGDSEAWLYAV